MSYRTDMTILQFPSAITKKIYNPKLWRMHSACQLNVALPLCVKFQSWSDRVDRILTAKSIIFNIKGAITRKMDIK